MACRGVHFALTEQEARCFESAESNDALIDALEEVEERWNTELLQETDKAWDAIHRCLTNGRLEFGDTPFHRVIFGDENLLAPPASGHVSLVHPDEVKEVADAIRGLDEQWMRVRYYALDPREYEGEISEGDFEYTWHWFVKLKAFFEKAAAGGWWVSFTVWY